MAAFMLATLISALFALPAYAAGTLTVATTPVATAAAGSSFDYVTTVTEPGVGAVTGVAFTDTIDVGSITAIVSSPVLVCTVNTPTSASCASHDFAMSEVVTYTVTVTAPGVGPITNTATATATVPPDTDSAVTITAVTPVADVTITKSHAGTLTPGSDVTYSLQVNNAGPSAATTVSVSDTLNASLTFKSSASSCTAALQVVTCPVLDVPAAGNRIVTFVATIGAAVPAATVITNTATVSTATAESNAGNNTSNVDSITVGAGSVDLGVTLTVLPTTASPGDTVTYTVTVTNPDTVTDATNVVVTDTLPAGLTPVTPPTAPSAGTAAVATNTWTWTIPTVAKATSGTTPTVVTASLSATVDADAALGTITNTVTMTAAQTDPTPANNTASADLTVSASVADLHILTAVDNSKPSQGDKITISIQISNAGPADATNVLVRDVLPKGLKYDSCKPCSSGLRRSTSHQFLFASIPATTASTVSLTVTVQASSGTLKNTATIVSADQGDPIATNDKDSLNITIAGTNNSSGGGGGGTGGTSGSGGSTGGTTAFTGFTSAQLMPWFLLLFSIGLAAIELGRRKTLVSPIGYTYGFDR